MNSLLYQIIGTIYNLNITYVIFNIIIILTTINIIFYNKRTIDILIYNKVLNIYNKIQIKVSLIEAYVIGTIPIILSWLLFIIVTILYIKSHLVILYFLKLLLFFSFVWLTLLNINTFNFKFKIENYKTTIMFLIIIINVIITLLLLLLNEEFLLYHVFRSMVLLLLFFILKFYKEKIFILINIDSLMETLIMYELRNRVFNVFVYNLVMYGLVLFLLMVGFVAGVNINIISILVFSYLLLIGYFEKVSAFNLNSSNGTFLKNTLIYKITKRGYPGPDIYPKLKPFTSRIFDNGFKTVGLVAGVATLALLFNYGNEKLTLHMSAERSVIIRTNICYLEDKLVKSNDELKDLIVQYRNKSNMLQDQYIYSQIEIRKAYNKELMEEIKKYRDKLFTLSVEDVPPLKNVMRSIFPHIK